MGNLLALMFLKCARSFLAPKLTQIPQAHPVIWGIAHIRVQAISIFDLAMTLVEEPSYELDNNFLIITEYNRTVQGFLVTNINRIIKSSWAEILPPPTNIGPNSFLTAFTKIVDKIIEIIDVEKVLAEVLGVND